jgi:hypothetical protein
MTERSVVAIYDRMREAEIAIHTLNESNYPVNQISIVSRDLESEKQVHGFITAGDVAKSGASTGAWVGGLFGILVGAAFLWIPGFGPLMVAGPFAAILLGGAEGVLTGAVGGGLLGTLIGWGVSKKHIIKYEERLKGGKYLVIAHGSAEEVEKAHSILEGTESNEIGMHQDGL